FDRRDTLVERVLYRAAEPESPVERGRKCAGSAIPDRFSHPHDDIDLGGDLACLLDAVAGAQDDDADVVLHHGEESPKRTSWHNPISADLVVQDNAIRARPVTAEVHNGRSVLVERLEQVVWTHRPARTELDCVAVFGRPELRLDLPRLFVQRETARAFGV